MTSSFRCPEERYTSRAAEIRALERQAGEVDDMIHSVWQAGGVRAFLVWLLLSAYLLGLRTRLWLLRRGWIG